MAIHIQNIKSKRIVCQNYIELLTGSGQRTLPPPPLPEGGCTCSNYIANSGFGNCQKKYKNDQICYVNEPSTCKDLVKSKSTGKRFSWEACATSPPPLSTGAPSPTPPPPASTLNPAGCSCSGYISSSGFGNCKKVYKIGTICYVKEPSTCSDLRKSKSTGKSYSWEACKLLPPPPPPRK